MEPISYDFSERMTMSDGVNESASIQEILLDTIAGARKVFRAHSDNDRGGVDWWVEMANGSFLAVDAKVREEDFSVKDKDKDDLALETWSVVEASIPGWTRNPQKRTDYILWLWRDTGRFCLVPFAPLCVIFNSMWQEWSGAYKTARQVTPWNGSSYHSECVFVPRRVVWAAIYQRLNGKAQRV